jgi:hypothetical protein
MTAAEAGMSRPLTVAPFNWADRIEIGADVEDAIVEAFLADTDYSFATYFDQVTFGFVDIRTGARVLRRTTLPIGHQLHEVDGTWTSAVIRDDLCEVAVRWLMAETPESHFGPPLDRPLGVGFPAPPPAAPSIIFMLSPPSPAGNDPGTGFSVLDWNAPFDYMAHELGHALGWVHSRGDSGEYKDPYCLMSAQDYAGHNPTHARVKPPGSRIPGGFSGPTFWAGGFGPMPAGATLVRELPEFRASSMVIRIEPDHAVTLRALSEAHRGDPVIAAMEYENEWWMAELRVATNWDRGIVGNPNSPGEGVILHTWAPGGPDGAVYRGRIDTANPLQPSFQPTWSTRMKLVVDYYDPGTKTVEVRFTEGPPPYSFGGPAPEFVPFDVDPACQPGGLTEIGFEAAYDEARTGSGRPRFQIAVTDAAGQLRDGYSHLPRPDPGTGGIILEADVCRDGRVVGQWTITVVKFDLGLGNPSYMFTINENGVEITGALGPDGQAWQAETDGLTVVITGWQTAAIF